MGKVSREAAEAEVLKWLDFKKVKQRVRDDMGDAIEALTCAIEDGDLILREDFFFELSLANPIDSGDSPIKNLVFKPRLRQFEIEDAMKGLDMKNGIQMMKGIASALTDQPRAVLGKTYENDWGLIQNISVFFIPR